MVSCQFNFSKIKTVTFFRSDIFKNNKCHQFLRQCDGFDKPNLYVSYEVISWLDWLGNKNFLSPGCALIQSCTLFLTVDHISCGVPTFHTSAFKYFVEDLFVIFDFQDCSTISCISK